MLICSESAGIAGGGKIIMKELLSKLVILALLVLVCFEMIVHLVPIVKNGKIVPRQYEEYPMMYISQQALLATEVKRQNSKTFSIKWSDSDIWQNSVVTIELDSNLSPQNIPANGQITAKCDGIFFHQTSCAVNVFNDVIYIQISGYRKTLLCTTVSKPIYFAIKILN